MEHNVTITEVKIRKTYSEGLLMAVVSIVINDCLAVHDIRIIQGQRLFVAMPSKKSSDGMSRDLIHPMNIELRCQMEEEIIDAYLRYITNEAANYEE